MHKGSNESGGALLHIRVSRPLPWPAAALGHRCRLWRSSAAACGNLQLLPEACSDKRHRGNLQREPEDKLSLALKVLAFLGSSLEDSEDMSVSAIETGQISAGIRPYVQPRQIHFPLGRFWHDSCFLFGARAEDGEGACAAHPSHPPLPLPRSLCWGTVVVAADPSHPAGIYNLR